jgi:hypothetical protein
LALTAALRQWAVLGSKQSRQRSTLDRSEPESACLQALLWAPWRADFGPEQLFAGSRVVNRWSAGVALAVNAGSFSHLRCICVWPLCSSRLGSTC